MNLALFVDVVIPDHTFNVTDEDDSTREGDIFKIKRQISSNQLQVYLYSINWRCSANATLNSSQSDLENQERFTPG